MGRLSLESYYNSLKRKEQINRRVIEEAQWYIDHRTSVREVAENFMVGKSTVHKDFTKKLKDLDFDLYDEVSCLLHYNKCHSIEKMNRANELRRLRR